MSYKQNTYRGSGRGLTLPPTGSGYENFLFGFMLGAVESKVNFNSGDDVKFSGGNLGVYATLPKPRLLR